MPSVIADFLHREHGAEPYFFCCRNAGEGDTLKSSGLNDACHAIQGLPFPSVYFKVLFFDLIESRFDGILYLFLYVTLTCQWIMLLYLPKPSFSVSLLGLS